LGTSSKGFKVYRARVRASLFCAARWRVTAPPRQSGAQTPRWSQNSITASFFRIYLPNIKSDAPWALSWMAVQHGLPSGVQSDAYWVPSWMTVHIRATRASSGGRGLKGVYVRRAISFPCVELLYETKRSLVSGHVWRNLYQCDSPMPKGLSSLSPRPSRAQPQHFQHKVHVSKASPDAGGADQL
jgi:hypothetical protein